ncbi:hypothetical protein M8818_006025 [Zalaria obscura]|uniref:Uncharacterized protein n=1 Tax=Zalaria obscura TaxID=2024903 RepID=A0ACC3S7Q8_9PEZI
MGWLWTSSSNNTSEAPPTTQEPIQSLQPATASPSTTPPRALTRDEQADREFQALVASFDADTKSTQPSQPSAPTNHHRQDLPPPPAVSTETPADTTELDISPDALIPRTMSCRQAFDSAFYCQSLGGKFNDIYRYGELKSCSEHWNAFWFCMRTRTLGDGEKERQIREYYENRDDKRKREWGSSEDVWDIRMSPIQNAFSKNPDDLPAVVEGDGAVVKQGRGGE